MTDQETFHAHGYQVREEYRRCGTKGCTCRDGKGHGPYWYAVRKRHGRVERRYIGRELTPYWYEVSDATTEKRV